MSLEHGNRRKVIEIELLESNVGLRVLGILPPRCEFLSKCEAFQYFVPRLGAVVSDRKGRSGV